MENLCHHRGFHLFIALLFMAPAAVQAPIDVGAQSEEPASEDAPEAVRSTLQEWRDTLMYGINSEISDLIPTLTENREEELAPEVADLFRESNDSQVLTEAARYLTQLEVPDGHDRGRAIVQEELLRGDDLLVAVMNYLRDTDADVDEATTESLVRIAVNRSGAPAGAAVRLMGSSGVSTETLIELYEDPAASDDVRGRILLELGERDEPQVYEFVTDIIREDEEAQTTLQRYAIDTLGRLGNPQALPTILRQMDSEDALTRAYAVNALASFDTPEAADALLDALRDEFWRVRVAALEAVAERRMEEALPAVLYKVRRDPERRVRLEAIKTVAALDHPDGWDLLEERFRSSRTSVEERSAMAEQLITNHPADSLDVVLEVMQEEWDTEDSRVLDIIGRITSRVEDQRVEPIAARLLDHPNFILQIYGLRAVGRSRLVSLVEIAEARAEEGNHRAVRQAATRALEQLGPR